MGLQGEIAFGSAYCCAGVYMYWSLSKSYSTIVILYMCLVFIDCFVTFTDFCA